MFRQVERKTFEAGKVLLNEGKYAEAWWWKSFDKAIELTWQQQYKRPLDILRQSGAGGWAGDYMAEHARLLTSADENRSEYMDMLAIIYTKPSNTDMDINTDKLQRCMKRQQSR